jgi:hypothetical protein
MVVCQKKRNCHAYRGEWPLTPLHEKDMQLRSVAVSQCHRLSTRSVLHLSLPSCTCQARHGLNEIGCAHSESFILPPVPPYAGQYRVISAVYHHHLPPKLRDIPTLEEIQFQLISTS